MPAGRATSGRPARGPKMEKTNLVLETGLRIVNAQTAVDVHQNTCNTSSALDLPNTNTHWP